VEPGVPRTRTGAAFKALIAGAIVLILLLVFILENTQSVKIRYFGASGNLPLGVALLIAAVGGALLVGIVGVARILQLRRHVKRRRRPA
jgi:lipopolysaccharide assembly protein A